MVTRAAPLLLILSFTGGLRCQLLLTTSAHHSRRLLVCRQFKLAHPLAPLALLL